MAAFDAVIEGQGQQRLRAGAAAGTSRHPPMSAWASACSATSRIAILHAQAMHKLGRVATVDWDVHHGNGTQAAFYRARRRAHDLAAPGQSLPGELRRARRRPARARARATTSTFRCRPARATAPISRPSSRWWCRRCCSFRPELIVVAFGLRRLRRRSAGPHDDHVGRLPRHDPHADEGGRAICAAAAWCMTHEGGYSADVRALLRPRGAGGDDAASRPMSPIPGRR